MIADLQALALLNDPRELRTSTSEVAAILLAAGIDPERSTLFRQSDVPEHAELAWILNSIAFEDELMSLGIVGLLRQRAERAGVGLTIAALDFPVLIAADVLLYQVDVVPAGEEERESIDLARTLALRFNERFGETFKPPRIVTPSKGAIIRDLQDPSTPMRKTSTSGAIFVLDPPDVLTAKVAGARIGSAAESDEHALGFENALMLLATLTGNDRISRDVALSPIMLKRQLTDTLIETLLPLQTGYTELRSDGGYVDDVLVKGGRKARTVASATLAATRKAVGLRSG